MLPEHTLTSAGAHLTESDIQDVLIGESPATSAEHLAHCELCKEQVEAFTADVASFNQASLSWAEEKSNTLPRDLAPRMALTYFSLHAAWSIAAVLLLTITVALTLSLHHRPGSNLASNSSPQQIQTTASNESNSPSQSEIAQDNAMMAAIASEMEPAPSPIQPYEPRTSHRQRGSHATFRQVKK